MLGHFGISIIPTAGGMDAAEPIAGNALMAYGIYGYGHPHLNPNTAKPVPPNDADYF